HPPVCVPSPRDPARGAPRLQRALPVLLVGVQTAERPVAFGGLPAVRSEDLLADPEPLRGELLGFGVGALVDERPREFVERRGGLGALSPVSLLPDRERLPEQLF